MIDSWNRGSVPKLVWTFALLAFPVGPLVAGERDSERVTRYDLASRGDLLLSRLVAPESAGDVAEWSRTLLGPLGGQVGDWVTQFLDATALAGMITEAFPVDGQPPLRPIDDLVAACAGTLDLEKPAVHVRRSPMARAYVVHAAGRHHLVLTSGMLDLFAGRPEELKFVVGRELGHIKCGHADLKNKGYAILSALQGVNVAVVPDRYQNVLPTLALGRLFTWCREAEISADRAGLLCCGTPKPAYEAIMRLQHGLRADSPWIDPSAPGFDPDAVIKTFRDWQYQPFVKFLLDLKQQPVDHPYYQERLAALKAWVDTGAPAAILGRKVGTGADLLIEVVRIRAYELAAEGASIDPYVIVMDGDRQVLRTRTAPAGRDGEWSGFRPGDPGVDQPRPHRDGKPVFFEAWDDNLLADGFVGGFAIYPESGDAPADGPDGRLAEYTARIVWDWKESQAIARPGYAKVQVRFTRRGSPVGDGKEGAKR